MERGTTIVRLRAVAAIATATASVCCGTGVRDGRGEVFLSRLLDQQGGQIVLKEATLDICESCLSAPAAIMLRRYDKIEHSGAASPVFEVELPSPYTLQGDPTLGIATTASVAGSPNAAIGFMVPSVVMQWVPDSAAASAECPAAVGPAVCGPVQVGSFREPDGNPALASNVVLFAIVIRCSSNADCPQGQGCTSSACQECPQGSACN